MLSHVLRLSRKVAWGHFLRETPAINCPRTLYSSPQLKHMDLKSIVAKLDEISPGNRAEEWDNVGLLLEPSKVGTVERILLTNDLTEQVMDEAESKKVGLVVSYHPPLFRPIKRLTQNAAKDRIILRAVESQVAIYSPHTALDSIEGGVNDWLLSGIGDGNITPIRINRVQPQLPNKVVLLNPLDAEDLRGLDGIWSQFGGDGELVTTPRGSSSFDVKINCNDAGLVTILPHLRQKLPQSSISVVQNALVPHMGGGRLLALSKPAPLSAIVKRVKSHLHIPHLRLARPAADSDHQVTTIAACAGSGASVLRDVRADVYLTGEMSHHDVLDAASKGTAVILCEHSNTERGYLRVFQKTLEKVLGDSVEIVLSETDREPLQIV